MGGDTRAWCRLALALGSVVAGAAIVFGCSPQAEEQSPQDDEQSAAPAVEVATVSLHPLTERRRWSGRLEAQRTRSVQAPRRGRVASREVSDGDRVEAGDVLFRLADPGSSARREVLAERRDHLRDESERWQSLAEAQAAGPAEVSEAKLRLLEIEELLAELDASLGELVVRAPVAGSVTQVSAVSGVHITEGQELARIDEDHTTGVSLTISSRETVFLEQVDRLSARDDRGEALQISTVEFYPDIHRSFVTAEVIFDDSGPTRRREVELVYEDEQDVLLVPWTAVASDGERHRVSVISGEPPVVEHRDVDLGRAHSQGIEIVSGVQAGEKVMRYDPRSQPEGRDVEPREREQ